MSRKTVFLGLGLLVVAAGAVAVLGVLVYRVPEPYRMAAPPEGPERVKLSREFWNELTAFVNDIKDDQKKEWYALFTEERINSYLEEDFVKYNSAENVLPQGISAPRVAFLPDKVCLAFRYGKSPWSPIVSVDLGVWLPKEAKEPNALCLEIQGLHAGSLPISSQSLLEQVYETARKYNIDVTWYRHQGNPVALLRFQTDQRTPTVQLQGIELHKGKLVIRGKSIEPAPLRAMLPPGLAPQESN